MNVVIVKLSSLGDVVHSLPVAATLRTYWPRARLTWLVERHEARILAGHPALDRVVAVDTRTWRRLPTPLALARAWRGLRRAVATLRPADITLELQGLLKTGVLAALTRAPLRIGFGPRDSREPLSVLGTNLRVGRPPRVHVVDQYLALLRPLGVTDPVHEFRLPRDPDAEARVDDWLTAAGVKTQDRLVVLCPGAGKPAKRWPPSRFGALAQWLVGQAGARAVVAWGPHERPLATAVAAAAADLALVAPPTDLFELIALLRRAHLVVAGDTGPLHLAAALGRPCVGIFGPTRAWRNGPYGRGHRVVEGRDGRVDTVTVDDVAAAAGALLA